MLRLFTDPTCCYGGLNIRYLLLKASEEGPPVLFHLVGRVASDRFLITLNLVNKAGTKPVQIAI